MNKRIGIATRLRTVAIMVCAVMTLSLLCACSESDENGNAKSELAESVASSIVSNSNGVYGRVLKNAISIIPETGAVDGDILIAYNTDTFEACCFSVNEGSAKLMYEGDYKGSYSRLEYIDERTYDDWSIMVYRINKDAKVAVPTTAVTELANTILDNYTTEYGELLAGAVVFIQDQNDNEYQYIVTTGQTLKLMDYNHSKYDCWRNSDDAENYWAKLVSDDGEYSWAVYVRDELCSEAFNDIADTYDAIINAEKSVDNGALFVWKGDKGQVVMRYEDGGMYYVQLKDFESLKTTVVKYRTEDISGALKSVEVYVDK